jgi:hypothetical protein
MWNLFVAWLFRDNLNIDKCKFGYLKWLDNRINDNLYNIWLINGKYKKLQNVRLI